MMHIDNLIVMIIAKMRNLLKFDSLAGIIYPMNRLLTLPLKIKQIDFNKINLITIIQSSPIRITWQVVWITGCWLLSTRESSQHQIMFLFNDSMALIVVWWINNKRIERSIGYRRLYIWNLRKNLSIIDQV